jgi:hypothetical protein
MEIPRAAAIANRCRELPWPDQRSGAELQAQLYDETGLPA